MADRYWVGGTGTWNTTSTTNWSATAGGSSGASVPTINDNVFFSGGSGTTYTVTMTGAIRCANLTITVNSGATVTFAVGTSPSWQIGGSITRNVASVGTLAWNVAATLVGSGAYTIDLNALYITVNNALTINGTGSWTLNNNLTLGNTQLFTHTSGTLNLNGFTLTTGRFSSSGSTTRTLNWGSSGGLIVTTGATTSTVFDMSVITNLTLSGSKNLACQGGGTSITKTVVLPAIVDGNSINLTLQDTSATVTYSVSGYANNVTLNGTQIATLSSSRIYGNFNHATTNTTFGTSTVPLWGNAAGGGGTKDVTLISAVTYGITLQLNQLGTWRQVNNINTTASVTHNGGTWDFNNKTFTATQWSFNNTAQCAWLNTGGGSTFTLNANLTLNAGTFTMPFNVTLQGSNVTFTLTAGTWNLNEFVLNCGAISSSNSNTRVLSFGTLGKIVINRAIATTIINISSVGTLTTTGRRLVECGGGGGVTKTITMPNSGLSSALNIVLQDASACTYSFSSLANLEDLTINGPITINNQDLVILGNFTHLTSLGSPTIGAGAALWRFNAASGTKTLSLQANFNYDFPMAFGTVGSTATWNISGGNFQLGTGTTRSMTLNYGTLDFNGFSMITGGQLTYANAGNATLLNTGSSTLNVPNFQLQNGSWSPAYAINCSAIFTLTNGTLTLGGNSTIGSNFIHTAGSLILNGYTLTTATFSGSGTGVRTINFGTSKIICSRSTAGTVWSTNTVTNLTIAGTPVVDCTGGGGITKTIDPGNLSEANGITFNLLDTSATYNITSTTTATVKNLVCNGTQTVGFGVPLTIFGTLTHLSAGGTTTFSAGTNTVTFGASSGSVAVTLQPSTTYDFPITFGIAGTTADWTLNTALTLGSTRTLTLTAGTVTLGGNVTTGAFISNNSNTRQINFGTYKFTVNSTSPTTIWNTSTLTGLTYSGTGRLLVECTGAGAISKTINTGAAAEADALDFSLLATAGTYPMGGSAFRNLVINGTQTISSGAITIYGNYTHSTSGGTTTFNSSTAAWTFASTQASQTITSGSVTHEMPWTFNAGSSTVYLLQSAVTLGATRKLTFTNGQIDLNGFTLTTGFFENSSGTQSLIFDGGTLTVSGVGTTSPNFPFYITSPGSISFVAGTGATPTISMTGATAKSFVTSDKSFAGIKLNQGGAGNLDVSGSTTWGDLSSSISATSTGNIRFAAGSTQTFQNFTLTGLGTAANRPQVMSSTSGSAFTIYREPNQAGFVFGASNMIATDVIFTPYTTNDFIRWYIGSNSQINNSTGVLVQDYVLGTSPKVYVLTSGTSWVVPADFNHTTNNIYLFGAGGSGETGGNGGQGGGGGGYSRGDNVNLLGTYAVSCYIPGGGDSTACTFHTLSAGSASGRIGGTGTHGNGGNGGTSPWFPVTPIIGGSGGGAGGPWGNGANGVNGVTITANTNRGGHGGSGAAGGTAGASGAVTTGGNGGSASANAGTGTGGTGGQPSVVIASAGVRGGGGGGAGTRPPGVNLFQDFAGAGGNGIDILSSLGAGGGGGSGGSTNDANWTGVGTNGSSGGRFGGGGGGGGYGGNISGGAGGGGSGAVIIVYVPVPVNKFFGVLT